VKIALAIIAILVFSCARAPRDETPPSGQTEGFAIPSAGILVLIAGEDGELRAPGDQARVLRPFPLARSPMAIQPIGDRAIIAVNRVGLRQVGVSRMKAGASGPARLVIEQLPGSQAEFDGRTVSSSWSKDNRAFFLLFRHPVYELDTPRTPPSIVIEASTAGAGILEPGLGPDAYAAYPVAAGTWLVQRRSETPDRVVTDYASYDPETGTEKSLSRSAFEKLASPMPLSAAPASIRAAADALAGPLLIEARLPDGSRRAYSRGDPGEAAPTWGQDLVSDEGISCSLLVTDDWRIAVSRFSSGGYTVSVINPGQPFSEARVRDAALIDGVIVIAWEEAIFPDIGFSGLAALDSGL
jgi:hypothetical protein